MLTLAIHIWCHHVSTEEGAVNRICFIPAWCECFSICNRIRVNGVLSSGCVWNRYKVGTVSFVFIPDLADPL